MQRSIVIVDDIPELRVHMRKLLEARIEGCVVHEIDPLDHYPHDVKKNLHAFEKFCRLVRKTTGPNGLLLLDHWFGLDAPWNGASMLPRLGSQKVIVTCNGNWDIRLPMFAAKWKLEQGNSSREAQDFITLVRRVLG